jgi:hypothetical protein
VHGHVPRVGRQLVHDEALHRQPDPREPETGERSIVVAFPVPSLLPRIEPEPGHDDAAFGVRRQRRRIGRRFGSRIDPAPTVRTSPGARRRSPSTRG